jgi:putative ABC transport system permease protein
MIDSLELNIRQSFDRLGNDVMYVDKWSWADEDGEYKWWEYLKRPNVTKAEMELLQQELQGASSVSMSARNQGCTVKYGDNNITQATQLLVSDDYDKSREFKVIDGRFISKQEFETGAAVAILGHSYYTQLFKNGENALGELIFVNGNKLEIIGVLEKEGKSMIDISFDNTITSPLNYGMQTIGLKSTDDKEQKLVIRAKTNMPKDELMAEIRGNMRAVRHLKPKDKDNFSINELSIFTNKLTEIFSVINLAGLIIGLLSILVGGFGIANIMFVSVKERTNLIGIKKALGARKSYIIFEFLIESILLCIVGGAVGLLLVYGLALIVTYTLDFSIFLSLQNILKGVVISSVIGLVAGLLPAISAANLDPVEAIRSK